MVLTESLDGDHRRDFRATQLLRRCQLRDVIEHLARNTARLPASTQATEISTTDAIVALRSQSAVLARSC